MRWLTAFAALGVLVSAALCSPPAWASKPRLRLQVVDARRCAAEGLLQLYAAELELEGTLRRPAKAYQLWIDGKLASDKPLSSTPLAQVKQPLPTHLALVLQHSAAMARDLPAVVDGMKQPLRRLPKQSRLDLIAYGWKVAQLLKGGSVQRATQALDKLSLAGEGVELVLDQALRRGLRNLAAVPEQTRRLLVVVSDGLNHDPNWDIFRRMGTRAGKLQLPIYALAYSPIDERGPMLNLGELAKRSAGTFRWAQQAEAIEQQLANLARELSRQQVLSYRVQGACQRQQRVQLVGAKLRSNILTVAAQQPATPQGMHRTLRVVLFVAALLAAALLLFLVTRWLMGSGRKTE